MWYKKYTRARESLPEFDLPPYWERRPFRRQAATSSDPQEYIDALRNVALFSGDVAELFREENPGRNLSGFSSLYVSPDGEFYLIPSHQHNEIARDVLRAVDPNLPPVKKRYMRGGGYTATDLARTAGIQRVQIYNDGMGVTIDMAYPPTSKQLQAIREAYSMTPMRRFVAEIVYDGKPLTHLHSFRDLVYFVNNFDPDNPEALEEISPELASFKWHDVM